MPTDMNAYMKERWKQRRQKAIEYLGGRCIQCGTTENLEFDHIDPSTKVATIAKISAASEQRFWAEVDKCQLLCSTHHREKTIQGKSVEHGQGMTGKRNCYCELCKPLKQAYNKARKIR
jgi:hypothetical protein